VGGGEVSWKPGWTAAKDWKDSYDKGQKYRAASEAKKALAELRRIDLTPQERIEAQKAFIAKTQEKNNHQSIIDRNKRILSITPKIPLKIASGLSKLCITNHKVCKIHMQDEGF
jgi:hypothetical protein